MRDDGDDDACDATSRGRSAEQQTGPGLRQQQQHHPHPPPHTGAAQCRLKLDSPLLSSGFEMLPLGGRMCGFSALLSVLLAGVAAASSDLFDNQLGDINYCKKQCQLTIKNKSPAKVSYPRVCCRVSAEGALSAAFVRFCIEIQTNTMAYTRCPSKKKSVQSRKYAT